MGRQGTRNRDALPLTTRELVRKLVHVRRGKATSLSSNLDSAVQFVLGRDQPLLHERSQRWSSPATRISGWRKVLENHLHATLRHQCPAACGPAQCQGLAIKSNRSAGR